MDEIGELTLPLQAKLLRAIQEKEVRQGGSVLSTWMYVLLRQRTAIYVRDTRRVFSRGPVLPREHISHQRSGLVLKVGRYTTLANYFLVKHGREDGAATVTRSICQTLGLQLAGYVRELENVVQRAIVLSGDGVIRRIIWYLMSQPITSSMLVNLGYACRFDEPSHTPSHAGDASALQDAANNVHTLDGGYGQRDRWRDTQGAPTNPFSAHMAAQSGFDSLAEETSDHTTGLQGAMDANEFRIIVDTIKNTRTRQEAADMLGISQRTLRYKIARMRERGIQIPKRRSA